MNPGDSSGFGVNLIAYIRAEMGLGTAARGVAHALEAARLPFNIINFEHSNPALHRDESWRHKETLSSSYDFTLLVINPDNLFNAKTRVQKNFVKDRYSIGYWFWELPEIPDNWQSSFALIDEVWTASRFIQDAISAKSPVPVFRVPVPVQLGPTDQFSRNSFSLPEHRFLFLSMSDAHSHLARKNPLGAIRAFKKAFRGDNDSVGLVLKISNIGAVDADEETIGMIRGEMEGYQNIHLLDSDMTRPEVDSLLALCDCFVSLHRSEGFGLGPSEAMSLGKPAILTNWSGNTDYMTADNSIGIDYELVPVGKQYGPYRPDQLWADPDLDQAAVWMRRLVEDSELAKRTGMRGEATIKNEFSPEAVGKIIQSRLNYLDRSGIARATDRARAEDPTAMARFQTFAARGGMSDAQHSNVADVIPGQWCRLKIDLPWGLGDGTAPFRFDPVDRPGIVDLAAVTLRATATADVLWRVSTRGGLDDLRVCGTAVRLPHNRLLRLLSYDEDPQIYLPHVSGDNFEEPLTLEVLLRFDRAPESVERAVSSWNDLASASSSLPLSDTSLAVSLPRSAEATVERPASGQIAMVVYSADDSGYSEERTTQVSYASDRWSHLTIALQLGLGPMPLRLDPSTSVGLIDVASLTLRSALDDEVLWRANGDGELETLQVSGSAVRIPHPSLARILSYGEDPQIYLPAFPRGKFDGPLRLDVWLKTETGLDSIRRGISELASMSSQAVAATSQTQGLLEESNRAFSEKEAEIDELRAALQKAENELRRARQESTVARSELAFTAAEFNKSREELRSQSTEAARRNKETQRLQRELEARTSRVDQVSSELALLRNQLAVEQSAKVRMIEEFSRVGTDLRSIKQHLEARKRRFPRNFFTAPDNGKGDSTPQAKGSSKYPFWLDSPTGSTPASGKVFFSGWVLPPPGEKILAVRALSKEEQVVGQYGFERSDVAAAFSDRPEALYAGFSIGVSLSVGSHEVALQALIGTTKWVTFCLHQQEVLADPSRDGEAISGTIERVDTEKAFEGLLETPRHKTIAEYGLLLVTGWVHFETQKIAELCAYTNHGAKTSLSHSSPRDDVAAYLPHLPSARYSGFAGYIPLDLDYSGPFKLQVEAVLADGTRMVCFQRDVLVELPDTRVSAAPVRELSDDERYARWVEKNKLTPYLLKRMASDGIDLAQTGPLISVIVPTFNTPALYLEALLDSLKKQLYPNWQLCLADDASTEPHVRAILERAAAEDSRIAVVFREKNGHIVQASNSALALAKGDYVGLLDHDDLLSPDALLHVAEAVASEATIDFLYTDEDKLSPSGERYDPIFKGSFSPEMSLTHNYIQHFTVIRRSLLNELGGFRDGFEGAQDLDLYLRVLEKTAPHRVRHLPFVCYHWRSHPESTASTGIQKSYVFDSARTSISDALERRQLRATPFLPDWAKRDNCCLYQLKWSPDILKDNPVTIIIPTKDRVALLGKCLASLDRTVNPVYANVVIVDDFSEEPATRSFFKQVESRPGLRCRVIQPSAPSTQFNFSRLINEGVAAADTELVLLLNNDTEARETGWLEEMVGWMTIDGVGAVGAKLLYPDNTIQHAGVVVGPRGGLAEHIFHRLPHDHIGFNFLTHAARNVSAVTAACLLTSKKVFEAVGGFDQDALGMEYNDVDFCLRLSEANKRTVFTPQAVLLHRCGQSRGEGWRPDEHLTFLRRYGRLNDRYYNENLNPTLTPMAVNPEHFVHKDRVGKLKVLMVSHNLNLEGAPKVLFDHAAYFAKVGEYSVTVVSREDGPLKGKMEAAGIPVKIMEGALPDVTEGTVAYTTRLRQIGAKLDVESFDLIVCNTLTSFWGGDVGVAFQPACHLARS